MVTVIKALGVTGTGTEGLLAEERNSTGRLGCCRDVAEEEFLKGDPERNHREAEQMKTKGSHLYNQTGPHCT